MAIRLKHVRGLLGCVNRLNQSRTRLGYQTGRSFTRQLSAVPERVTEPIHQADAQPGKLSREELNYRRQNVKAATLGDIVSTAKKFRKPVGSGYNLDLYKNYFVTAINESATVKETADFMVDRQVGSLFVVDNDCTIKGFVTEHNLIFNELLIPPSEENESLANADQAPTYNDVAQSLNISKIMKPVSDLITGNLDTSILQATKILRENNFRHLPVLDKASKDTSSSETKKPLRITDIAHIVSVKGLIAKIYLEILATKENQVEILDVELENVNNALGLPTVKQVIEAKIQRNGEQRKILNTDIQDDITIFDAVQEMRNTKNGYVAVMDYQQRDEKVQHYGKLLGIITERDVLHRVIAEGKDIETTLVKDVMTKKAKYSKQWSLAVCSVHSAQSLLACMKLMWQYDVRHLPVTNKDQTKIVGIITSKDVVEAICESANNNVFKPQ